LVNVRTSQAPGGVEEIAVQIVFFNLPCPARVEAMTVGRCDV
jgi:hypothetical protein